jgi:hypothetical protein
MREFLISGFGICSALAFISGCSPSPQSTRSQEIRAELSDKAIPKYPSRYWEEELRKEISTLTPDERSLLEKFMSRHVKRSLTMEQVPVPDGATIKQAIFAERIVDMVSQQREGEISALRELVRKQEAEIAALKDTMRPRDELAVNSAGGVRQQSSSVPVEQVSGYDRDRQAALINYGVLELEKQLQISMEKDRADPRWAEFQTDSPVTASIRSRLIAARLAAEHSVVPPRR